jgi:hypothetical protein
MSPLVDPVIERVLAEFERRAEDEQRRTPFGAPGTNLDDLLLSVGREAGIISIYWRAAPGRAALEARHVVWLLDRRRPRPLQRPGGRFCRSGWDFKIEHARQA